MMKETDPNGIEAHQPGAKLDAGKALPHLVLGGFAPALAHVVAVGTFGAQKYTRDGWLSVPDGIDRYSEAMMRHWLAEAQGESIDDQSGLLHAAHLAWNALARLTLMVKAGKPPMQRVELDPLPEPPPIIPKWVLEDLGQMGDPAAKPWYPDDRNWVEVPDDCMACPVEPGADIGFLTLKERNRKKSLPGWRRAGSLDWDVAPDDDIRIVAYTTEAPK